MKLRTTTANRIMLLMPALLLITLEPVQCMGMSHAQIPSRIGITTTTPASDPFSSVYAGILDSIRPAGTLSHVHSCSATSDFTAEQHDVGNAHKPTFPPAWGVATDGRKSARSFNLCPWSGHRDGNLNGAFNTLYTVSRFSGIASRRIPKLAFPYWRSLSLPSSETSTSSRTALARRSQNLAKLAGPFGKVPIADLVKANIFRLVSLASW